MGTGPIFSVGIWFIKPAKCHCERSAAITQCAVSLWGAKWRGNHTICFVRM